MVFAADYPLPDVLWTMIIFVSWVAWTWLLIPISDLSRREATTRREFHQLKAKARASTMTEIAGTA
jgi:hypothetical protein